MEKWWCQSRWCPWPALSLPRRAALRLEASSRVQIMVTMPSVAMMAAATLCGTELPHEGLCLLSTPFNYKRGAVTILILQIRKKNNREIQSLSSNFTLPASRAWLLTAARYFCKQGEPRMSHPLFPGYSDALPSLDWTMKWIWASRRSWLNFYCFVCCGKLRLYDFKSNYLNFLEGKMSPYLTPYKQINAIYAKE